MSTDLGCCVRDERPDDAAGIRKVVRAAFGQEDEARLVGALRRSGDAAFSLVAESNETIVGHLMLSKLLAPQGCLALAPLAVEPPQQRKGIGSALVRAGLEKAAQEGWSAVFVLGDPTFYERFGFSLALAARFETGYPKDCFMALGLAPDALAGTGGAVIYTQPFVDLD